MPESQAMVIPKGKHAVVAVAEEAGAGVLVGLEQIGLEMLDSDRMKSGNLKDDLQWEAAQNVVPIVQTAAAIIMATVPKGKTVRKVGSLLIGPSATMAAYRGAKFLPQRLSVTAHRISNNRSISAAREKAASPPQRPGQGALTWTPSGLTA